jgi:hypothetical protein
MTLGCGAMQRAQVPERTGSGDHIGDLQTGNFRDPAAGVIEHRKHNAISVAAPGSSVRGIENGLHLGSREKAEERFVEALHRNREHPLDDGQCRRFPEGRKMEERTDGRKPGIATTDLVMPFVFQIVEESQGRPLFGPQMKNAVSHWPIPQNSGYFYSGMTSIAFIEG